MVCYGFDHMRTDMATNESLARSTIFLTPPKTLVESSSRTHIFESQNDFTKCNTLLTAPAFMNKSVTVLVKSEQFQIFINCTKLSYVSQTVNFLGPLIMFYNHTTCNMATTHVLSPIFHENNRRIKNMKYMAAYTCCSW